VTGPRGTRRHDHMDLAWHEGADQISAR
jgi:hypothetical protein